jgi:hypothetical protein
MTAMPEQHVVPFEKPPSPPPRVVRMRASDIDRQATVRALQDALARGQLTFEEAGERMTAAWDTRFVADLAPLTADLPPAPEASDTPGWRALAQMAMAQLRATLATAFPDGPRSVRARLALAVALMGLIAFVLLAGATAHALFDGGHDFGPGFDPGNWHPGPHPHVVGP